MHYGLTIMSSLALTIGIFIIFNSFTISLNQRWKEIGILRALGVTRGQVQRMFLAEAAVMGLAGAVIGVAAGFGLALVSMRFVGDVMSSFYGFASTPAGARIQHCVCAAGVAGRHRDVARRGVAAGTRCLAARACAGAAQYRIATARIDHQLAAAGRRASCWSSAAWR